jgi:hypothetical protein
MSDPGESHRLTGLHAERHDVLDLEVDRGADANTVPQPIVLDLDCSPLNPNISPISGASPAIGPPSWPLKTWTSLSNCASDASSLMNTPTRQFPSVITFGVSMMIAALHPARSVSSTAPSRMLKTRVARQKSYVAP